jgi:hypothetical protein
MGTMDRLAGIISGKSNLDLLFAFDNNLVPNRGANNFS